MTFRQLKYFSTIYECKSLASASQKLYISQQGLSRILCALESEVGTLFIRQHYGLTPTPLGTALYSDCQPVLREMALLEQKLAETSSPEVMQLNIALVGGTRYLNTINLRQIWQQNFQPHYPKIRFNVKEMTYAQGLEFFTSSCFDMITYSDYSAKKGFCQVDLNTWERVLLVPKGHPLYGQERVSPQALKGERLLLYTNMHARDKLLQYCKANNCQPAETINLSDTLYMYDTCQKQGCLGLTIANYYAIVLPQFPDLREIRFTENFLPYTVSAIFRADHPATDTLRLLANSLKSFLISCSE